MCNGMLEYIIINFGHQKLSILITIMFMDKLRFEISADGLWTILRNCHVSLFIYLIVVWFLVIF
jgi:hypothetical protein